MPIVGEVKSHGARDFARRAADRKHMASIENQVVHVRAPAVRQRACRGCGNRECGGGRCEWSPADDSFAEHVRKPPPTTCVDQRVPLGELEATCNTGKVE